MSGPPGRGGPQLIPRPDGWRPGDPAPWAGVADRTLTLDRVLAAVEGRQPAGVRGRQHTGEEQAAGVLVALYDDDGPHVVLTRRSPRLASHTHEVSFPGGRHDADDPDLWSTALREAEEEYPGYGFAASKGYPSPVHRAALAERGATAYHRRSWSFMEGLPPVGEPRRDPPGTRSLF